MPLRRQSIELDALAAIERTVKGQPIEGTRVELKSEWIDPGKAARRLAAHANSARGEPILWLVGVDEKHALVPGVAVNDFADWWAQLQSRLDGPSPDMTSVPVVFGNVTVMALAFETDRAPYVFVTGQDPYLREVPWRDGTRTRSATREELLRLLIPVQRMPSIELVATYARLNNKHLPLEKQSVRFEVTLYVEPVGRDPVVFPYHRCTFGLGYRESNRVDFTQNFELLPEPGQSAGSYVVTHPLTVRFIGIWERLHTGVLQRGTSNDLVAEITLAVAGTDKTKKMIIPLRVAGDEIESTAWRLDLDRWKG